MEGGVSVGNGKENVGHPPMSMEVQQQTQPPPQSAPMRKIVAVASISAGVNFGWALQFSLLTPYIQFLGIPHKWASFIWLCGPISGMVVQPLAGHFSDQCTSRFGRRRPFIAAAAALVAISVILIGFAADIGRASGDRLGGGAKPRAIVIFVVGFWILDVGNNLLMSPCRAFLSDLSGHSQQKMRNANAFFSFFGGVGSVLGYAAGSYSRLHNLLPFTLTTACEVYCANLKSCFLISITLLLTLTVMALSTVHETPLANGVNEEGKKTKSLPFFGELFSALKHFPKAMWILLLVTALGSVAWFAFILYDTDWMGKEVYGGAVGGKLYDAGVHAGSFGLMLNSAAAGVTSLAVIFLARDVRGGNWIWGGSNIFLGICLAMTVWISKAAESARRRSDGGSNGGVKAAAITLFALLGIPQAISFTIPFALAATYSTTAGLGQGLTMGVLNIAVVIPQLLVSLTSGPWDELFGGGNLPSFVVGAISAAISGVFALTLLPSPRPGDAQVKIAVAASHLTIECIYSFIHGACFP